MEQYKNIVLEILKKAGALDVNLEVPPNKDMGDFSVACFSLAKQQKKSPNEIAKELQSKIDVKKYSHLLERIEVKGPYLNFFVNRQKLIEDVIKKIFSENEHYGSSGSGKGKKALIEHTSINPNASPHVGRARNALIGDSIVRIFKFEGYNTEVHYFVNDVGKQIAILVMGCAGKEKVSFNDLLQIYVDTNNRIAVSSQGESGVFVLLNKLEKGDKDIKEKFRKVVDICIKGQAKILSDLGIKYDFYDYESKYLWDKKLGEIIAKLQHTGKLFVDEEGRKVLNQEDHELPMKSPVLVLTRADGTSLYPLRDLAYTIEKIEKPGIDRNIIILGEDQKLYFMQINAALGLLSYKAPESVHYAFVLLKEGKMSTRKGNVVLLEDFMKEAREKALAEIKIREKAKDFVKTSRIIGYGALKFAMLKISPDKNVTF
ncbi:MAG: arginine--tRNA ligase, partial [Nanoarchaeota archaeon]|nr:arginine--tRNA ligase [Nanoarchaeota archaeon]